MDLTCGSGRFDDDSSNEQTAMHTTINNGSDGQQDVKPLTPAQELRKATKPLMEKRRRARINQCLQELKDLILEALNKDPARHNKLEKADILEMAVTHLKNVHRQNLQTPPPPAECVGKYRAGFTECANEVSRFVNNVNVLQPEVKQKLIGHLSSCISTLDASPITPVLGYPTVHSPPSQLEIQGGHGAATPPLSYSPFPPNSPSSHRSSPPVVPAQLVAFPGMLPPLNQDLNNNNTTDTMHHEMDIGADEDDAPLDFSKKYSPTHPGTTGGFPNPRKKYLASVSRGSSSSSSEELPHSSSDIEMHLSPSEPVNYSKNVYGGASAPRFSFVGDHRFFMCDEDDDMWRPW